MNDPLTTMLVGLIFLFLPVVAIYALRYADVRLAYFSIPSFLVISYFLSVYIGSVSLYFGLDHFAVSLGVVGRHSIDKVALFSAVALALIVAGFIFARHVVGLRATFAVQLGKPVESGARQRWFFILLVFLCVGVLLVYLVQIERIALLEALSGDVRAAAVARSRMGTEFEGDYWRYQLFFRHLLDLCLLYFVADYLISKKRISAAFLVLSGVAASFSAVMAIEKGPIAKLFLMVFFVHVLLGGGRYIQRRFFRVVPMFITLMIGAYMLFMGAETPLDALRFAWTRASVSQLVPAYFYVEQFPTEMPFLLGRSFPNPGGVLPFEPFPLTIEISAIIFPHARGLGVVGSAPTVFWGEMYANFGTVGVFASSFLVGIGVYVVAHIVGRQRLTAPIVALTSFLAMHYRTITGTGLSAYVFDTTLLAVIVVTVVAEKLRGAQAHSEREGGGAEEVGHEQLARVGTVGPSS